jgi:hypothetical protein
LVSADTKYRNIIKKNSTFAGGGATSSSSELSESDSCACLPFPIFAASDLTAAVEMGFGFGGTSESLSELESADFLPV